MGQHLSEMLRCCTQFLRPRPLKMSGCMTGGIFLSSERAMVAVS